METFNEVIGTPIRVFRPIICPKCGKHFEFDISTIKDRNITLICPWCDHSAGYYQCEDILSSDRIVRYD